MNVEILTPYIGPIALGVVGISMLQLCIFLELREIKKLLKEKKI